MLAMLLPILTPILGTTTSAPPNAASLPVMDAVLGEGYLLATAEFATDEETGRAWVEATIDTGGQGEDYDSQTLRPRCRISNTTSRPTRSSMVGRVTSGACENHNLQVPVLKGTRISATAHCELRSRFERRVEHNRFERERHKHLIVEPKITR